MRKAWNNIAMGCLAALLIAAPCGASGQPTRTTILLDGSFDDWQTVFANPVNTIIDGDGSNVTCNQSRDRDCAVTRNGADINRVAYTWDDQFLYLYLERLESSNNVVFLLYVDVDHDGYFDNRDFVLEHEFRASRGEVLSRKRPYSPLLPGGDPTEDALGFGDGYSPSGVAGNPLNELGDPGLCPFCTSADGLAFEYAWPWSALGITAAQAVILHMSSAGSVSADEDDNVGGADDRRASTRFYQLALDRTRNTAAGPGQTLHLPHVVTNQGNAEDIVQFHVTSSLGMEVCIYDDPDRDGLPDSLMGCDRQGNGSWADNGDVVQPSHDTNGDGIPDTGTLAAGNSFAFVGVLQPQNKDNKRIELTRFFAGSLGEPSVAPFVRDEIAIGHVTLIPKRELRAVPGATVRIPHMVANHLPTLDIFDLTWLSSKGWNYTFYSDPNADGDPSDGAPLFDTDGDTDPDVNVPSGGVYPILALGTVPIGTPTGTVDSLELEVRSSGNSRGTVVDKILVAREVELRPDHKAADGLAKAGSANYPTFFRHYLTWNGSEPAQFDLSAFSSLGYRVSFFSDPNGDGNPADGELLPEPAVSPMIEPYGGTWVFLLRVSVPSGAPAGMVDTTQVFAVRSTDSQQFDSATDETLVTQIQLFADANQSLSVTHAPVCDTVYARATGLAPAEVGRYRIVWDDPLGQRVRTTDFISDGAGEGFDTFDVPPNVQLGPWSVSVQEDIGGTWGDLDRFTFEVENEGSMDALFTERPTYSIADTSVTVTAIFRNGGAADLGPLEIEFRILNPDRTLYLKSSGEFRDYTNKEFTWKLNNLRLAPQETFREVFSIVDLVWPAGGQYFLEGSWRNQCGDVVATSSRTFFVTSDQDGDGLTDDTEAAAGLDWQDQDSDDDGIPDGTEGLVDSDGDTTPDALSCDADGDGILDSVEAGLILSDLGPDSDPQAGCFMEDADAGATVTDPTRPDTDDGGLADGIEDANRNGMVDAGEKDPSQGWDDPCSTLPPPEAQDLRLRKVEGDLVLSWTDLSSQDPCVRYRIWESAGLRPNQADLTVLNGLLASPIHAIVMPDGNHAFLIQATGAFAGDGPLGYQGP